MKDVYYIALAMETPGRYIIGESDTQACDYRDGQTVSLLNPAHLTVLKDSNILTPIDVVDVFRANLSFYPGIGELNKEYVKTYRAWLKVRANPPKFGVEDSE